MKGMQGMQMTKVRRTAVMAVAVVASALLVGCEPAPPAATFTMTTTADGLDAAPGDGVCEVTPGVGDCSLRAAFADAFGTAPALRTRDDILTQLRADRDEWGDR